jgi:hypothetical protein
LIGLACTKKKNKTKSEEREMTPIYISRGCKRLPPTDTSIFSSIPLTNTIYYSGHAPRPPESASAISEQPMVFREAEQRFLLLFLEKEEYHQRFGLP